MAALKEKRWCEMADVLYLVIGLVFFGACLALAGLCDRLLGPAERM